MQQVTFLLYLFFCVCEDPAEDFDLDSLLYDIVKFDPSKVVQQQTQPQQLQSVSNNVQAVAVSADVTDSGALPTVNEQQSSQDGNIHHYVVDVELLFLHH